MPPKETFGLARALSLHQQGETDMIDDPKTPTHPVEEPNERPMEVPDEGGDTDFPGNTPDEVPEDM